MSGITDRVALVTGSSRGIGRAIAVALAREGADIAVNYKGSREGAEATAGEVRAIGRRAEVYQADITLKDDCLRLADAAVRDFGHVDILVNNGGIGASTIGVPLIVDTTTEQMESLIAHHVMGGFHLSQALLPQMRTLGRGDIIMISSQAAQSLAARMGAYNIAKGIIRKGPYLRFLLETAIDSRFVPHVVKTRPGIRALRSTSQYSG